MSNLGAGFPSPTDPEGPRWTFLDTLAAVRPLLACDEVRTGWGEPSALDGYTVGGLVGHLVRASLTVATALGEPEPDPLPERPVTAGEYFALVAAVPDPDRLHAAIRRRGDAEAAAGPAAVLARWDALGAELGRLLPAEPPERWVTVFAGLHLRLDDYLRTRLVELVVHADDVAASVGIPTPGLPPAAVESALQTLVEVARRRHGDLAVVRAMARRERDDLDATRAF